MNPFLFLLLICVHSILFGVPTILVTGGAGYIGSHTCYALKNAGFQPVVYDSLITGDANAVKWGPLVVGDLQDAEKLDQVFAEYNPVAVIHFAALRDVDDSMKNPYEYYHANVTGTLNLLHAMVKHNVRNMIASSSCAVYGISSDHLMNEQQQRNPISPYATTKYVMEKMIEDFAYAYSLQYVILRYFNVVGIDMEAGLKRPPHSGGLIPKAMSALLNQTPLPIFGIDYATPDGTAIRDYIHVKDLANAHVLAWQYLQDTSTSITLNLGTGKGASVFDVVNTIEHVTGRELPTLIMPRREGDIPEAVADPSLSRRILNFVPQYSDLQTIIESEYQAITGIKPLALR